ncbi:MAG: hypothetical protein IKX65_01420 [Prevotella sp.]|nr:hypothetical protein [Prevotella sp.]
MSDNKGSFWPSYVDIMTTLFAIMLVLFVVSYSRFKVKEQELQVLADHFIEIIDIYDAVGNIDSTKFEYNEQYSKNIFKLEIEYQPKEFELSRLQLDKDGKTEEAEALRAQIKNAGDSIRVTIQNLQKNDKLKKDIKYLVVIEGQASKIAFNDPDPIWRNNYTLSYLRALNLHEFWKENGIDFSNMERCELVICGSGEEGKPRYVPEEDLTEQRFTSKDSYNTWANIESKNQRFLVHIVPVIGKLNMDNKIKDLVEKYRIENQQAKNDK